MIHSRLGWTKNAHFLEQFRYIIVASQLLNEHSNPRAYKRQSLPPPGGDGLLQLDQDRSFVPSWPGLSLTGVTAFVLAWLIRWLHLSVYARYSPTRISSILLAVAFTFVVLYCYMRRQWLHYLRVQAVQSASSFSNNAQYYDAAASAGITLIQEVELVSRGYSM